MREGDRAYHDVLEPPAAQQRAELLVVGEPEERRPDGDVRRRTGTRRRHRLEKHAEDPGSPGYVPDRQREPAARDQNPRELVDHLLRPADMQHQEVGDHGIEGAVRKRQCLRIAATELELRMESTCEREHPLGDVDADDRRTSSGCPGSHVTRSRSHVEDAVAAADLGCVEQRFDEPSRDGNEELVVPRDLRLPARCLERVERVRVDRGIGQWAESYDRGPGSLNASTRMRLGFRLRPRRHTGHAQ